MVGGRRVAAALLEALLLTGAPKHGATLRLSGAATVTGTLEKPDRTIPREVKSGGNIFKSIGRAITGDTGPKAQNAACGALARQVLR